MLSSCNYVKIITAQLRIKSLKLVETILVRVAVGKSINIVVLITKIERIKIKKTKK